MDTAATTGYSSKPEAADDSLTATELRLGLPGTAGDEQTKATPPSTPRGKKRTAATFDAVEVGDKRDVEAAPPVTRAQVVGWPPVRSYRKSCFQQQLQATVTKQSNNNKATSNKDQEAAPASCNTTTTTTSVATNNGTSSFVKVSMDGAAYLRKVDLRMYKGYRELREALEAMFNNNNGGANQLSEFAVTYQDKDGDLMLVGDVPFEMFASTCKKLRIMKRSEATGLGSPRGGI